MCSLYKGFLAFLFNITQRRLCFSTALNQPFSYHRRGRIPYPPVFREHTECSLRQIPKTSESLRNTGKRAVEDNESKSVRLLRSSYFLGCEGNTAATIRPKTIAALIPAAAPVIPPESAPISPFSPTAFRTPFASV